MTIASMQNPHSVAALPDVYATVSPHDAEPLLGFPVLNQVGRFTIDTITGLLIMG
jgi:hypothetical protein